ncbi:Calx-beta domain-containing protein, partial [Cronbergia sp. UHCC 0137]|uniref:Calx-beta domain-containing protein n=1 Tax=Cronbergia sp. UHCC 0137 TaxID=3110239 RepID=UPI002B21278C
MAINGTANNDELFVQTGNEEVFGLEGDDILDASNGAGNNTLDGGPGNDRLLANNNDILIGGIGEDSLFAVGSIGKNNLNGGEDSDRLFVLEGSENELEGGAGDDELVVSGGTGNNILRGGLGQDILNASNPTGNNILEGGENNDILIGGVASDRLFGGLGNDLLFGGKGGSELTGDAGADRFYLTSAAIPDVPVVVNDFTQGDDKVIVAGIPQVKQFSDLILEQTGDDTTVKANINGTVRELGILRGIQANTLTPDDFGFETSIFSIASASAEEGSAITFTITRTGDTQANQSVTVSTAINEGDTASTNDFTAKTETLTFATGETTKTFTVATTEDSLFEADETFSVTLSDASSESLISPTAGAAKGTITNDDPAPVFSIASASATEGTGITFIITRTGDAQANQSVTVSTAINTGDTASNTDFTAKTETLTFATGETTKTFTVETTQD